jgi:hypothetical protein
MRTYVCVTCNETFETSARGRPRKRCPDCATEANRAKALERYNKSEPVTIRGETIPQCCVEWRASGKRRKRCPQHSVFAAFRRLARGDMPSKHTPRPEAPIGRPSRSIKRISLSDKRTFMDLLGDGYSGKVSLDPDSWLSVKPVDDIPPAERPAKPVGRQVKPRFPENGPAFIHGQAREPDGTTDLLASEDRVSRFGKHIQHIRNGIYWIACPYCQKEQQWLN